MVVGKDDKPKEAWFFGPYDVISVHKVYPQGYIRDPVNNKVMGERTQSLIKVNSDPGGIRVLAVADIWAQDPGKATRQWP